MTKNDNIKKLLMAIALTDRKHGVGACNWQAYLMDGNLSWFTSSNDARKSMADINHEELRKDYVLLCLKNILNYYETGLKSSATENYIVNGIVQNIDYYRTLPKEEVYSDIEYRLLNEEFSYDSKKIMTGNIMSIKGGVSILSVNEKTISFLSEFITFLNTRRQGLQVSDKTVNNSDEDIPKR